MEAPAPRKTLRIPQADSKRVLALYAHLRQILRACVSDDGKIIRPIGMDHADLLLAAASFRTLFFDHQHPVLLEFLNDYEIEMNINSWDSELNLFLLSWYKPDDTHVSDFLAELLLHKEMQDKFPVDEKKSMFLAFTEGDDSFEFLWKRRDLFRSQGTDDNVWTTGISMSNQRGPSQDLGLTRRIISIHDWGSLQIGFIKDTPITRRSLLNFVANRLGGVHWDATRNPPNPDDRREYEALFSTYDWDKQSIMHAGFVGVALACIELLANPVIRALEQSLGAFHDRRQSRLMKGEPLIDTEPST